MALDEGTHPDLFTGVRIAGEQLADYSEFVARAAVNQKDLATLLVFDQSWCAGHGVTRAVVTELLLPDDLASVLVQCDHLGIQRAEVDLVAIDRRASIDHITAGANVRGQAVGVAPETFAGTRIEREHA